MGKSADRNPKIIAPGVWPSWPWMPPDAANLVPSLDDAKPNQGPVLGALLELVQVFPESALVNMGPPSTIPTSLVPSLEDATSFQF